MGITRAQIARQLLAGCGVSLNDAKAMAPRGEFLAYINPKEANMLKQAGGSGIMTPMGIPSFVDFGGPGSGYGSAQDTFDAAGGNPGKGGGPSRSDTGTDTDAIYQQSSKTNQGIAKANRSFAQKIADAIRGISKFSPIGNIAKGLGKFFQQFRGFNPDGTPKTQAQFELERQNRINQNRIADIMGRKAPFTAMTLENLAKLGYTGPLDGLIGSTNITRSGTPDDDVYSKGINATNVANNFLDFDKTISSEDLGTIQSRIEQATGVPMDNIQLARNYTKQDLEKLGADTGIFGANDQLEALEEYYNAVQGLSGPGSKYAPNNPAKAREFIERESNKGFGMGSYSIDMDLVPKDFLETQQDLQQQKSPFELLDV